MLLELLKHNCIQNVLNNDGNSISLTVCVMHGDQVDEKPTTSTAYFMI